MRKKLVFAALLLSAAAFSQDRFSQYSLEADYGFNHSRNPKLSGLNHFGAGFRYMANEYWGVKFDYGFDSFDGEVDGAPGSNLHRFSAQAVYNVGRALNSREITNSTFNVLLHAGFGGTLLTSDNIDKSDKIGNVILGGTGQLYISDRLALTGDVSGILNFRQSTSFDGFNNGGVFTGKMLNVSIGITYYLGRNLSRSDWR